MAKAITENTLFYGDSLENLRDYVIDEMESGKEKKERNHANE